MAAFPIFKGRRAWLDRLFCCASSTPSLWVEFQLTAGDGAPYDGYLTPGMLGAIATVGAVAPEPHPVHIARALVDAHPDGYILVFAGDCAAELDASVFVINGVECAPLSPAVYDGGQNVTQWQVDSAPGDRFVPGGIYVCQVVPA